MAKYYNRFYYQIAKIQKFRYKYKIRQYMNYRELFHQIDLRPVI